MTTPVLGTPEHAAMVTAGRHPGTVTALAWLCFSHLPSRLQDFSRPIYQTAVELIVSIQDSAELTTALNTMVTAKDWAVRAGIRSDEGSPGPVPRPATIVEPPEFGKAQVPARPDQQLPHPMDSFPHTIVRPIRDEPRA